MITLKFERKSADSILIGSVLIRQWPEIPDSALPARTLAILVQQPLPSQYSVRRSVRLGKSRGGYMAVKPGYITGV